MEDLRRFVADRKGLVFVFAGVLLLAVAFWSVRLFGGGGGVLPGDSLSESVTVRFDDTNASLTMPRGDVVRQLLERPGSGPLPTTERLANPKTLKLTGIAGSESAWKKLLEQVNQERSYKGRPVGAK